MASIEVATNTNRPLLPTPSAHLTTEAEIDEFVDDALDELEEIRVAAKKALGQRGEMPRTGRGSLTRPSYCRRILEAAIEPRTVS